MGHGFGQILGFCQHFFRISSNNMVDQTSLERLLRRESVALERNLPLHSGIRNPRPND